MILTCQQCSTQFYLARQSLAPDGRMLKCSKCKAIWFQDYVESPKVTFDELDIKSLDKKKNKIFLPAVIEKKHPILLETMLIPIKIEVKFVEIPSKWKKRIEGKSNNSFFKNFYYISAGLRIFFLKKKNLVK